jgi:hypothetical protein
VTNCVLVGNYAYQGGGAYGGLLKNCILSYNWSGSYGGSYGGGAYQCTLWNCNLIRNSARWGGGAAFSIVYNSALTGNSASVRGGGAFSTTLYNCTVTGNNSANEAGGVNYCTLYNCIVVANRARSDDNYLDGSFQYSCSTPLPPGPGNIEVDPQLLTTTHLASTSPCLRAGNPAWASGVDMDGEPWSAPPAMGADQPNPDQAIGPLNLEIQASSTTMAAGYAVSFAAAGDGRLWQNVWDFGDGTTITNQAFVRHAWSALASTLSS